MLQICQICFDGSIDLRRGREVKKMRLAKKKKIKKIAKQFSRVAVGWVLKSRVVLRSVRILLQPFSFFIEH